MHCIGKPTVCKAHRTQWKKIIVFIQPFIFVILCDFFFFFFLQKKFLFHFPGNNMKPGQCPNEVDNPSCSSSPIPDETEKCVTDRDCEGKKKCCFYKCYNRCLLPLEDKTDACPSHNATRCMISRPLPSNCHDDKQCQGSERCCCSNCNYKCVPTVKVKPGQCPPKPKTCSVKVSNNCTEQEKDSKKKIPVIKSGCETDMNCTGTKKCCDSCGNNCVTPIKEHSGFCPVSNEQISCGTILEKPLCNSDADCKLKDKCCLVDNHMECVPALKEKNGVCPPPPEMCTMMERKNKCDGDKDCIGGKKCCKSECIMQCITPINTPQKRGW
uniref:WAP domain-containing protein n=1 Tax=Leptobrachium leishanense TaxID=445787 RepID=A0A8C5MW24_9ANUR